MNAFGSETETIGSQSYSDSILTESFDTAKEQISDSSSSTDTLQTNRNQTDGKDFDTDHFVPSQTPEDPTSDIRTHINTDSDIQNEKNTTAKETDVHAEKDVSVEDSWCDTD
ncbi:NADH-quinone oxidoreductase subunit D [Dissostichus eleginoides]|nr:NADH-quinone oxidoreductase subunit D [Dissostichus eleginoides]